MTRKMRALFLAVLLSFAPTWALALCAGTNLIAGLPPEERAALETASDAVPYARGLFWQARRGDQVIDLIGTYHLSDPRHDALMTRAAPLLDRAAILLVEAGPEEEAALQKAITTRPELSFITDGPTLPERLDEPDWQALSAAMSARGVPAVLASKMQPWMVALTLGLSPCQTHELATGARGLDDALITEAEARGLPLRAVEPYDTLFDLFTGLTPEEELEMIALSMAAEPQIDDFSTTVADAYFAGDIWLIWELSRWNARQVMDLPQAEIDAQLAEMQEALLDRRNSAWIAPIEAAAAKGPVLLAVGALHLPGKAGVLSLLEQRGWQISPR